MYEEFSKDVKECIRAVNSEYDYLMNVFRKEYPIFYSYDYVIEDGRVVL